MWRRIVKINRQIDEHVSVEVNEGRSLYKIIVRIMKKFIRYVLRHNQFFKKIFFLVRQEVQHDNHDRYFFKN